MKLIVSNCFECYYSGYAMMQPLPVGDFRWLDEDEFDDVEAKVGTIADDADTGYVFEVDLEYPAELHNDHNDFPLAPEKLKVTFDMLSQYCQSFDSQHIAAQKLIPNLYDKKKYVVHYRNLQLYVELGLRITKVHRVLEFSQSPWMASYIQLTQI